jgi:hypothetical protein
MLEDSRMPLQKIWMNFWKTKGMRRWKTWRNCQKRLKMRRSWSCNLFCRKLVAVTFDLGFKLSFWSRAIQYQQSIFKKVTYLFLNQQRSFQIATLIKLLVDRMILVAILQTMQDIFGKWKNCEKRNLNKKSRRQGTFLPLKPLQIYFHMLQIVKMKIKWKRDLQFESLQKLQEHVASHSLTIWNPCLYCLNALIVILTILIFSWFPCSFFKWANQVSFFQISQPSFLFSNNFWVCLFSQICFLKIKKSKIYFSF